MVDPTSLSVCRSDVVTGTVDDLVLVAPGGHSSRRGPIGDTASRGNHVFAAILASRVKP
jgi:hypothetical protein